VTSVNGLASSPITIQGRPLSLPLEVRDSKASFAAFAVPLAAARALIAVSNVRLVEILPGRTVVNISAVEHIDNDLGRYNEVVVAFPVTLGARAHWPFVGALAEFASGHGGIYVHRMPVTTEFACRAGREIWGLPKVVADITIDDSQSRRTVSLTVDGKHALTLTVVRGGRLRFGDAGVDVVAIRDGRAWKTPSTARAEGLGVHLGGATLALGPHAIGAELAALGLPKRALLSGWAEHMTARFVGASLLDT
jgi:Acetoacetate decarboxylase (ADC)